MYSPLHVTPALSKGSLQAPTAVIPHQPTGAFTVEAEGHLNTLTGPAGRSCFLHSPHTGISPGIFAQGGLSMRLSLSPLKRQKRRDFEFPTLEITVFILLGLLRKSFGTKYVLNKFKKITDLPLQIFSMRDIWFLFSKMVKLRFTCSIYHYKQHSLFVTRKQMIRQATSHAISSLKTHPCPSPMKDLTILKFMQCHKKQSLTEY